MAMAYCGVHHMGKVDLESRGQVTPIEGFSKHILWAESVPIVKGLLTIILGPRDDRPVYALTCILIGVVWFLLLCSELDFFLNFSGGLCLRQ